MRRGFFTVKDMEDKRRNNGGHSTKSVGLDKRKNKYKGALDDASSLEDVVRVINALKINAFAGDVTAAKIYLEYYLGKPTVSIESEVTVIAEPINLLDLFED